MDVRILIPRNSDVAKAGFRGLYFLKKAMVRCHFNFQERTLEDDQFQTELLVSQGTDKKSWPPQLFFDFPNCSMLADMFGVVVKVDDIQFLPTIA